MKKYIILLLSLLMTISMSACGRLTESDNQDVDPPAIEFIGKIDEAVNDMIGDYVITTNYVNDAYSITATYNGIKNAFGTEEYENACSAFDEVAMVINEDFGINCVILIVSDENHDEVLYTTYNGKDVTNYIG